MPRTMKVGARRKAGRTGPPFGQYCIQKKKKKKGKKKTGPRKPRSGG